MSTTTTTPRIYVACLACYNDGRMRGLWIDATDADEMQEAVAAMQAGCRHVDNDWAIHDHEGFEGIRLGEYEAFATVAELGEAVAEHGEAFALFYENNSWETVGEAVDDFGVAHAGCWASVEAYAENDVNESGLLSDLSENLRYYFDFAAFGRDMERGGDIWTARGSEGLHVFLNV